MRPITAFIYLFLLGIFFSILISIQDFPINGPSTQNLSELRLATAGFPDNLNSATAYETTSDAIFQICLETPLHYQLKNKKELNLEPYGFDRWDIKYIDGIKEYTFYLETDHFYAPHPVFLEQAALDRLLKKPTSSLSKYQNTIRKVKVEDYVQQLIRLAHRSEAVPIRSLLRQKLLAFEDLEKFVNQYETIVAPKDLPVIKGLSWDEHFLKISTIDDFKFEQWATMSFFSPFPVEYFEKSKQWPASIGINRFPPSSGLFFIDEWTPGQSLRMKENPYKNNILKNRIQTILYSFDSREEIIIEKFLQGYIDQIGVSSEFLKNIFEEPSQLKLKNLYKKQKIQAQEIISPNLFYLAFNMDHPIWGSDDAWIYRFAIKKSLNWGEFCEKIMKGTAEASPFFMPKALLPKDFTWEKLIGLPRFKEVSSELKTLKLLIPQSDGTLFTELKKWLYQEFKKIGFDLVLIETDFSRFNQQMQKNEHHLVLGGWNADFPDPENFLMLLYSKNAFLKYGGINLSNFNDEYYDQLYERFKKDSDANQNKLLKEILRYIDTKIPVIPAFSSKTYSLRHEWIDRAPYHPFAQHALRNATIDDFKKREYQIQYNKIPKLKLLLILWSFITTCYFFSIRRRND